MHLVMFDLDGTLVDSHVFDAELYAQSIRQVLRIDVDTNWSRYTNVTDGGILAELMDWLEPAGDRREIEHAVKSEFIRRTQRYIEQHPEAAKEISGARALLELLGANDSVALAIATGGWLETAILKLRAIGIDPDSIPIATSSDAIERIAIMRLAESRCTSARAAARKTYFGDGPWDQRASAELNYDFIAIGNRVTHHTAFADLSDHAAILARLGV